MARLILVTVALAAVALVIKLRSGKTPRTERLRVTARTALHRGAVIAVVEVEGRRLLIGAGAQQVSLIAELSEIPDNAPKRPERPSELPVVPEIDQSIIEKFRRATTRTLDPAMRPRPSSTTVLDAEDALL